MMTLTIHVVDEVHCNITGLQFKHIQYFYDLFSYYVAGYRFSPKYELNLWDGKVHRFDRRGNTYVNLLQELIPIVVKLGYDVTIQDDRAKSGRSPTPITDAFFSHILLDGNTSLIMRDYQVRGVNALLNVGGGILLAGTGSGKTYMGASLIESYNKSFQQDGKDFKSITIVPDINLVNQTYREYSFLLLDVGELSGKVKDTDHIHIVSTWQSLQHIPQLLQEMDVLLLDECHGARADVLFNLLNTYGNNVPYKFGMTGTLPKDQTELKTVHISLGEVVDEISAHTLIAQGWLAKLQINILQIQENFTTEYEEFKKYNIDEILTYRQFKNQVFTEYSSEKRYLSTDSNRLNWIANHIISLKSKPKGNSFVLVSGIAIGRKLASLIPGAHFIHGKDQIETRTEIYDLFEDNNDVVVISTAKLASIGLSINRIFNMVFVDAGKSFIRVIQSVGRSLRKAEDKDDVIVTDICSDLKFSKKHLTDRKSFYKESKYPFTMNKITIT